MGLISLTHIGPISRISPISEQSPRSSHHPWRRRATRSSRGVPPGARQKLHQSPAFWPLQHLIWRPFLLDFSLRQKDNSIRNVAREIYFVGHDDHGTAFDGQRLDDL